MLDAAIFSRPAHLIHRAARLFVRAGESRLRLLGFSTAHIPVLAALKDGKTLSQKELAQIAQIEQPTMAQTLSRMERDGLIQRQPDPGDKRSSLISLCPIAAERMPQVFDVLHQGNGEALMGFDDKEKELLAEFLRRIIRNLEAVVADKEH